MLKCTKSARATLGPSQRIILRMGGLLHRCCNDISITMKQLTGKLKRQPTVGDCYSDNQPRPMKPWISILKCLSIPCNSHNNHHSTVGNTLTSAYQHPTWLNANQRHHHPTTSTKSFTGEIEVPIHLEQLPS